MNILSLLAAETVKDRSAWVVKSFPIIQMILVIVILICSVFMIVSVMLQQGNTNGMTGITGGSSDTFYNRNKGQSMQGLIKKLTIIDAFLILGLCLVYLVLYTIFHVA